MSLGLYLHIPYCFSKCQYCDFYSHPGELEGPNYLRLDNTRLSPEQAAARICEAFGWT